MSNTRRQASSAKTEGSRKNWAVWALALVAITMGVLALFWVGSWARHHDEVVATAPPADVPPAAAPAPAANLVTIVYKGEKCEEKPARKIFPKKEVPVVATRSIAPRSEPVMYGLLSLQAAASPGSSFTPIRLDHGYDAFGHLIGNAPWALALRGAGGSGGGTGNGGGAPPIP